MVVSIILLYFQPWKLGKWSKLTIIFFQLGWFNHQLAECAGYHLSGYHWIDTIVPHLMPINMNVERNVPCNHLRKVCKEESHGRSFFLLFLSTWIYLLWLDMFASKCRFVVSTMQHHRPSWPFFVWGKVPAHIICQAHPLPNEKKWQVEVFSDDDRAPSAPTLTQAGKKKQSVPWCSNLFCKWFGNGFWIPKHI